jgi:hypothetical protein
VELENHKVGKLPPAFGSSGMLDLEECTGTKRLNPHMTFKLFECENAIGPSDSIPLDPKTHKQPTSRSRKKPCVNNNGSESDSDDNTANNVDQLPPLPANDALVQAVSKVQIPMDGWALLHIFKLFVVLVDPPQGLDLSAIDGLHDYLTQLLVKIGGLLENGIREIASHCWWALMSKSST